MRTVYEEKINMGNNETAIKKGIYLENDGTYTWVTFTRSGNCKKLSTAQNKIK